MPSHVQLRMVMAALATKERKSVTDIARSKVYAAITRPKTSATTRIGMPSHVQLWMVMAALATKERKSVTGIASPKQVYAAIGRPKTPATTSF